MEQANNTEFGYIKSKIAGGEMADGEAKDNYLMQDVIIPSIFVIAMIAANALLFAYIMYKRRNFVYEDPSIYQACLDADPTTTATIAATSMTKNVSVTLEMEQLRADGTGAQENVQS